MQKLKEIYSQPESTKGYNISKNDAERILQAYSEYEIRTAANAFEQDRYVSANDLLDKCSKTSKNKSI